MIIEQLYTKCLSQSSYYIESDGEAAVIDPIRECDPYLDMAKQSGAKIKYVFETHFHADFVSGHIDLANKVGAQIVYGPHADTAYEIISAKDNQEFKIGKTTLKVLHTPGHTLESTSYLLIDEEGKDYAVFTGDTLFVGDVGRPDLTVKTDLTKEDLAGLLYDSLHNKIIPLADEVIVYPGHGEGSSCGKNLGSETWSTIGEQKKSNYALQDMNKSVFIKAVTEGLGTPPQYFFEDAKINMEGYNSIDEVLENNVKSLSEAEFQQALDYGAMVLDTRPAVIYEQSHIPKSINIGLGGQYAVWAGTLIEIDTPLIIVAEEGKEHESILRLARVGYENVKGYLKGGIKEWKGQLTSTKTIEAQKLPLADVKILDVRKSTEFKGGHIDIAKNYSLQDLGDRVEELDMEEQYFVHCQGGYRSTIACSILEQKGFKNVINVHGGYDAIKN